MNFFGLMNNFHIKNTLGLFCNINLLHNIYSSLLQFKMAAIWSIEIQKEALYLSRKGTSGQWGIFVMRFSASSNALKISTFFRIASSDQSYSDKLTLLNYLTSAAFEHMRSRNSYSAFQIAFINSNTEKRLVQVQRRFTHHAVVRQFDTIRLHRILHDCIYCTCIQFASIFVQSYEFLGIMWF